MWITKAVEDIAERIVRDRERMLGEELGQPPGYIIEQPKLAHPEVGIAPHRVIPKIGVDPSVPKKSSGVARIGKPKDDNSEAAKS